MITEKDIKRILEAYFGRYGGYRSSKTLEKCREKSAQAILDKIKEKENNKTGFTLDKESFKHLKEMSSPEYQRED